MMFERYKSRWVALATVVCGAMSLMLAACGSASGSRSEAGGGTVDRIPQAEVAEHVDREWVKDALVHGLLDYWRDNAVMENGFIQENLDREWKPWGEQREASLNGQGRMLYSLVIGYEMSGKDERYLDAVTKAADFLMKMRDQEYGGYYNRVTPDLKVIDDTKTSYVSFVIFSLAHAYRVTGNETYKTEALRTFHEVIDKMRDGPFFGRSMKRDWSGAAPSQFGRSSRGGGPNLPASVRSEFSRRAHGLNVHLFEAFLALYEATGDKEVWAEVTAELEAMEKLFDHEKGYLPESFDENWKKLSDRVNAGHLFEWASLLSRAVELGADPKYVELGSRNIDYGLKVSYDEEIGALGGRNSEGEAVRMLWWPQCEVVKASAHYAILRNRSDLWSYYHRTLDLIKTHYLDVEHGGWFEAYQPGVPRDQMGDRAYMKGAVDGPELSAYHQVSMFNDLWRISTPDYKPERLQKK